MHFDPQHTPLGAPCRGAGLLLSLCGDAEPRDAGGVQWMEPGAERLAGRCRELSIEPELSRLDLEEAEEATLLGTHLIFFLRELEVLVWSS